MEAGVLPIGLQSLRFGCHYNQKIEAGVLPIGLQSLQFGDDYNKKIEAGVLPSSLQVITLYQRYPYICEIRAIFSGEILLKH